MSGLVKGRDVFLHPLLIVRGFGTRRYLLCVRAVLLHEHTTFLEVACR
jgi:hypothetical protein